MTQIQQQDSDTEDQPQPQPQSPLPESPPDSENSEVQQPIDDSGASDQVSHRLIEEDEDSEGQYNQQYEEPRDAQDYLETMPSASGREAYHGPMKSKRNVPRVHLIVAEDDEEGIVGGEEGKGINTCVCVHNMFVYLYAMCDPHLWVSVCVCVCIYKISVIP